MALHWTYARFEVTSDLKQGDILHPTPELREIFAEVHPHFMDEKYAAFLVATQSCDLVLRRGGPKAPYVTLVTVRPLAQVASALLEATLTPITSKVFKAEDRSTATDFLSKLFNQNQQASGLFYLHSDVDSGIGEPSVAFLRVSVALRHQHYETLKLARRGRLTEEFQAKLGWLLGNLFARPATRDWEEPKLKEIVQQCMDDVDAVGGLRWLDEELVAAAREQGLDIADASAAALEGCRPKSRIERAIEAVMKNVEKVAPAALSEDQRTKLANRLRNDGKFTKLL
jgi:hypothetical protein